MTPLKQHLGLIIFRILEIQGKVIAVKAYELTIEEAWLYMPKPLKSLIRFLGMLMGAVVIVLCAI